MQIVTFNNLLSKDIIIRDNMEKAPFGYYINFCKDYCLTED